MIKSKKDAMRGRKSAQQKRMNEAEKKVGFLAGAIKGVDPSLIFVSYRRVGVLGSLWEVMVEAAGDREYVETARAGTIPEAVAAVTEKLEARCRRTIKTIRVGLRK